MHTMARRALTAWLMAAVLLPAGCAAPPAPLPLAESLALLQLQHERATRLAAQASGRRLWFAGFAMNATSKAFQGDLQLAADRFASLGGPVPRYEFSNEATGGALRYPFATARTLTDAMARIGAQLRRDDLVVVLISTHGEAGRLSVNAAGRDFAPVTAQALAAALAPLGDTPTVLLLSSCYAGSLIPALQRDNRLVLAASAADRASYGCQFESRNTFFIEELLVNGFDPSRSLAEMMARAQAQTAQRETALKVKPSQPQLWVGAQARWLAERPLKDWFAP